MLPSNGNKTWASHRPLIPSQHYPFYNNLAFAVVYELKFKDLLSITCQVSAERRVLDLESEAMRGPGSIPTGGNILSLEFFLSGSKYENANIAISVRM